MVDVTAPVGKMIECCLKRSEKVLILVMICLFSFRVFSNDVNPCLQKPLNLLNLLNRPSNASSACVVPLKHFLIESGYQYQDLRFPGGIEQNAPNMDLRLGLPHNFEFRVLAPNYIHRTLPRVSGFNAINIGIKHILGYSKSWVITGEGLITPTSGSDVFGSEGTGGLVNLIINYTFSAKWNVTAMLGGSTTTQSRFEGGERFDSINPDLVLTWAPTEKLNLFGEIYGQSKTGANLGSGFNSIFGILYCLTPNVAIDLEAAQHVYGTLNNFEHYVGAGISLLIG